AASVRPEQPSPTSVKSSGFAPRVAALLMNSGAVPVLATVTDCAALVVPMACAPNVSEVGVNVTAGAEGGGGGGLPPPPPPLPESAPAAGTPSVTAQATSADPRTARAMSGR